jgi:hypothetical protein
MPDACRSSKDLARRRGGNGRRRSRRRGARTTSSLTSTRLPSRDIVEEATVGGHQARPPPPRRQVRTCTRRGSPTLASRLQALGVAAAPSRLPEDGKRSSTRPPGPKSAARGVGRLPRVSTAPTLSPDLLPCRACPIRRARPRAPRVARRTAPRPCPSLSNRSRIWIGNSALARLCMVSTTTTATTEQHGVAQQTPATPERGPTPRRTHLPGHAAAGTQHIYPSPGSSPVEATSRLPRGQDELESRQHTSDADTESR